MCQNPNQSDETEHVSLLSVIASVPKAEGKLQQVGSAFEAVPPIEGDHVMDMLKKKGFASLLQLIPTHEACGQFAICEATSSTRQPVTHKRLLSFLRDEIHLGEFGIGVGDRCAILMPNGTEMAVCLLLCISRCSCVPMNSQQTSAEIRGLLDGTRAKALIVLEEENDDRIHECTHGLDIQIISLRPSDEVQGLFTLGVRCNHSPRAQGHFLSPKSITARLASDDSSSETARASSNSQESAQRSRLNGPDDEALILHTSGTSAACKRVPYTLANLAVGAACIASSWELGTHDVCFNMMPLFHIGGISRNVIAPILAGGGTVCAPILDPALFWESLHTRNVTWYYAGPTMHQILLEQQPALEDMAIVKSNHMRPRLRFVANASAALSEALAERIHTTYGCPVLPCYGMTECMPVSCPPLRYPVLHPASSGVVVGCHARILGEDGTWLGPEEKGEIVLKGLPVMPGYVGEGCKEANEKAFTVDGWFRTGDTGFLQQGGWLTVTGRSKEVINRGGELISPLEVEAIVVRHPMVREVVAFSCPHDTLQEVVGVGIVPTLRSDETMDGIVERRLDLKGLQSFVSETLHPSKWPQMVVFLDKLPKNQVKKVLRIGMSERMDLPSLKDGQGQQERMFEGRGPEAGAPLKDKIQVQLVRIEQEAVEKAVRSISSIAGITHSAVVPRQSSAVHEFLLYVAPASADTVRVLELLTPLLHDYQRPQQVIALKSIPDDLKDLPPPPSATGGVLEARSEMELRMQHLWADLLGKEVALDADFFQSGGNSLLAGRLVAQVRSAFAVPVPMTAAVLFKHRTVETLAAFTEALGGYAAAPEDAEGAKLRRPSTEQRRLSTLISYDANISNAELMSEAGDSDKGGDNEPVVQWWTMREVIAMTRSQLNKTPMVVQALPLTVLYPLLRSVSFVVFLTLLYHFARLDISRWVALIVAIAGARACAQIVFPVGFILLKWLIIGRFTPGRYPLWGQYYLRWWLVCQLQRLCGRGIFRHSNWSLCLYYRLLGAKIGPGTKIDPSVSVSEYDLVHVGARCAIETQRMSAFYMDQSTMVLEVLVVGNDVSVPCKVSLVPGIEVPSDTAFGPLSSSFEMRDGSCNATSDGDDGNARYCRTNFAAPSWYLRLFGNVVMFMVWLVEHTPLLLILYLVSVTMEREVDTYLGILKWFLTPERLLFYVVLRVLRAWLSPILRVVACIVVKWTVIGRFTEGPRCRSQWNVFKHWLMANLLPGHKLQTVAHMIGSHYEGVSMLLRALGAKVGKRIYWPGSLLHGLVEYDLLEVGDDVVFGSRTTVMICDVVEAKPVRIMAGAFVGDRCVLLPGSTVGKNAVLGSGGLASRGQYFPSNAVVVGSKGGAAVVLDQGNNSEEGPAENDARGDASTLRPFGKAMYMGEATYTVWPWWSHGVSVSFVEMFAAAWRAFTFIAALKGILMWTEHDSRATTAGHAELTLWDFAEKLIVCFLITHNIATALAILLAWASKWMIMGRRQAGSFDWDSSSYCQRWQLYLAATGIIRSAYAGNGILDLLHGSVYLVWWFRSLGAEIGNEVCLYPRGADPMMTEPDLIKIGSCACVDSASIIAHINSRGSFALNPTVVGAGASLRDGSRLLSGAEMKPASTLLDHTLVLGGEIVEQGATWQGWPGQPLVC